MASYEKFLPPQDMPDFHAPFWQSVRSGRAALQKCTECGTFRFIPLEICPKCHSEISEWTEISGRGEVYTYTVVHRAPTAAYQADAPYIIVHVTLDEGPRMISNLVGSEPADVQIGMKVVMTYEDVDEGTTLFKFAPA